MLRGGAYKPRTSPYAFQGMGAKNSGCWPRRAIPVVTEVMDSETLPLILEYADMLQNGARNMQEASRC